MKKNKLVMVLVMVFVLSLTACGNSNQADRGNANDTTGQGSSAAEQKDSVAQEKKSEGTVPKDGKILVAYFAVAENSDVDAVSSASVSDVNGETKGRMAALAEMLQEKTGGELFSIKTSVKYPGDIGKLIDYMQRAQELFGF